MNLVIVIPAILFALSGQNAHAPTLKETLEWMHSAFPDSRSMTAVLANQTRELKFVQGNPNESPSCTVTIVEHWTIRDGKRVARDTVIDLSLLDPDSIKSYVDEQVEKGQGVLTMTSTNDKKVIVEKIENDSKSKPFLTDRVFISFVGPEYAERFAKAFKNAVSQCGGKSSPF